MCNRARKTYRRTRQHYRDSLLTGTKIEIPPQKRGLSYDEMDKLRPCAQCGSLRYWFDGDVWQCWNCVPPPSPDQIRVDLKETVN